MSERKTEGIVEFTRCVTVTDGLLFVFRLESGNRLEKRRAAELKACAPQRAANVNKKSTWCAAATRTCRQSARSPLPSAPGVTPTAAATSQSVCDCSCSCCCSFIVSNDSVWPPLFSLPAAAPFFKRLLNAVRRGDNAWRAAQSPDCPALQWRRSMRRAWQRGVKRSFDETML